MIAAARRKMRITAVESIVLLLLALILGNLGWTWVDEMRGQSRGMADAQRDFGAGLVGVKGSGKSMYWRREYESILSSRFNARYDHVAECVPTPFDSAYIQAYNEAMAPCWQAKGIDLDAIASEARKFASRKQAAK
jgi:hypothetical protein